jgi:hypothetical protein
LEIIDFVPNFVVTRDCTDKLQEYFEILESDIGNIETLDCFDSVALISLGTSFEIVDKREVDLASGLAKPADFAVCTDLFVFKATDSGFPSIVPFVIEHWIDLSDFANAALFCVWFDGEDVDFCFVKCCTRDPWREIDSVRFEDIELALTSFSLPVDLLLQPSRLVETVASRCSCDVM